ncbi:MAG: iron ABC transporter permease [Candidatus Methanomethylophilaceae archaeon]|nr:iron ABC transporter permease [Candidatus Methanomethylophilaceae archaeon]
MRYDELQQKRLLLVTVGLVLCATLFVIDISVGSSGMGFIDVLRTLFFPERSTDMEVLIIHNLRLPPTLMAIVVGAALGLAGSAMQTILDNPMAEPYTLGISSASGFGAALCIITGLTLTALGAMAVPLFAFIFSMVACIVIYTVARFRSSDKSTILLTGIAVFFTFQALLSTSQLLANGNQLSEIMFWMFGSMTRVEMDQITLVIVVLVISTFILLRNAWKFTAMRLGDSHAMSLGVDITKIRRSTLIVVSVLTSVAVCFVGTIGFIGLIAPHISRFLVGEDHRYFMPMSMIVGAIILSLANMMSKIVADPMVFPIGILTSLIGIPFFFYLVITRRGLGS